MIVGTGSPEMCADFMRFAISSQGRASFSMHGEPNCPHDEAHIHSSHSAASSAGRHDLAMFQSFKAGWQQSAMRVVQNMREA